MVAMDNVININSSREELFRSIRRRLKGRTGADGEILLIEGQRQIFSALECGLDPEYLIFTQDSRGEAKIREILTAFPQPLHLIRMKPSLFNELAETRNSQGVIMLTARPDFNQEPDEIFSQGGPILILESIQDPGNTGTLIRTAHAFAFKAVFITEGGCQPYNDKALRASMGAVFRLPIFVGSHLEYLMSYLNQYDYLPLAADMGGRTIINTDLSQQRNIALLLGNEGAGISELARSSFQLISIPMVEEAESLNVAMAGTILCWEIYRQKNKS